MIKHYKPIDMIRGDLLLTVAEITTLNARCVHFDDICEVDMVVQGNHVTCWLTRDEIDELIKDIKENDLL